MLNEKFKDRILEYNEVELWEEPRKGVETDKFISEMSEEDHAFLCGMLNKIRPKKLLKSEWQKEEQRL